MSEKNSAHSVTINIPRQRTFSQKSDSDIKKNSSKKITNRTIKQLSDVTLNKYSLPDNRPLKVNELKQDNLLSSYKLYTKNQDKLENKRRLGIKLDEKYKIISTDLRMRLQVEVSPNEVQAVTDIDNGYFRYLNAHISTQYIPLYKSLKFQFHSRLRTKQEVGYRRDCVLNIEENHRREVHAYQQSVQKYLDQVRQFDVFISENYQKSMLCLKNCEEVVANVNAIVSQVENLASKQFTIQSRLIGLDYIYFMQQKYGRFLYYLSPPSWRVRHREFAHSVEIEAKGFDLGTSTEEDTFNVIFEKMQSECCNGLTKPVLYFSHPSDLMALFESLEKQQLHHFTHVAHLAPHKKMLDVSIRKIKSKILNDSTWVAHTIKDFESLVEFCEENEAQLQAKFMKILYGMFYDSVASIDVLKLQMHLEFCYEKLHGEQNSIISMVSTANALEQMYMKYSFQLDAIATNDTIKLAMKKCQEIENNKMKRAHLAAKELRLFNRMEHSLLRAYEKLNLNEVRCKRNTLSVTKRSLCRKPKKHLPKHVVRASSHRDLTEAEIEYLALFTDWTVNENPANYLQSLDLVD